MGFKDLGLWPLIYEFMITTLTDTLLVEAKMPMLKQHKKSENVEKFRPSECFVTYDENGCRLMERKSGANSINVLLS